MPPVFGLLKRGKKGCMRVVESCLRESLMPIIQGLVPSGSIIYTDGWKVYDGLILKRLRAPSCLAGSFTANVTTRTSSRAARATSTESRTFGRSRREGSPSLTVALLTNLCYT